LRSMASTLAAARPASVAALVTRCCCEVAARLASAACWRPSAASAASADESDEPEMEDDDDFRDRAAQRKEQAEERQWDSMVSSSASQGSRQASQVLMREMRSLMALQGSEGKSAAIEIEMVKDSLYHWTVKMHADGFPSESDLRQELKRFSSQHPSLAAVVMEVLFPDNYPMAPPFIRVVRPRFQMHSGHVTIGGSICMQLLTPSGWLPSVSLENVFVSIRSEMVEGGGRLDFTNNRDYSVAEAKEAFQRVAQRYGWLQT